MTVAEMEQRLGHRELMEWAAFYAWEREQQQEAAMDAKLEAGK